MDVELVFVKVRLLRFARRSLFFDERYSNTDFGKGGGCSSPSRLPRYDRNKIVSSILECLVKQNKLTSSAFNCFPFPFSFALTFTFSASSHILWGFGFQSLGGGIGSWELEIEKNWKVLVSYNQWIEYKNQTYVEGIGVLSSFKLKPTKTGVPSWKVWPEPFDRAGIA